MAKYLCYNINWDVDDEDDKQDLSNEMLIEIDDTDLSKDEVDEALSDKLSDESGFCHLGFEYGTIKYVSTKEVLKLNKKYNVSNSSKTFKEWMLDNGCRYDREQDLYYTL